MDLLDIAIAKKLAEGGGGGSEPTSYNDLSNLPQINGNTLVGDKTASSLGLQDEIDLDNKLSSDLVDDTNATNKFVTEEQKNTWNGKQNTIDSDHKLNADLVDDSTSTNKFVTSSDMETWNAKQNAIDSDHKLSSSLVNFSNAQAAALASGIDSDDVQQIEVNQTNILYSQINAEFNADTIGWYRIFELGTVVDTAARGATDSSCRLIIKRTFSYNPNEHHEISLLAVYDQISFGVETSKTHSAADSFLLTKIRYVYTSTNAYIDVYYAGSHINNLKCMLTENYGTCPWKVMDTITTVPETTSGETVAATYEFLPNVDLTQMVSDLQTFSVKVYTYHVNPNESDPEDAVTYLDDAVGMTPAKMGASTFSYGSWANAWFLPKPCMLKSDGTVAYYLNPNDYSKKTDGTASDIADLTFDGNVMLEFPKIWVKRVNDGNGARTVSIAPVNVDGTYKCWSNINAEDKEVDHFYLPAYNGTIDNNAKMRSMSGVTLSGTAPQTSPYAYAPNYTRAQEVTAATANNPSGKNMWYTEVWADYCLIFDLLCLMGKSLDVQRTFGQGLSSGSETAMRAYVTGTHNAKGLFYGDISGTSTAVKVLGMENLWGCRWHGVAGLINDNGTLKVKMTYGVADGSTAVGYNTTGSGYLNYGSTYGTNGFVKKMQADNTMGYKIIETVGTDATYYCDYHYVNNSQSNYALLGGNSADGADCGFFVNLAAEAAYTAWHIGGSLSCKP
jgi:hypothetical protein